MLKVSSADDHSKNSHLCMADYQLLLSPAGGGAPRTVDFLASDDDWDRSLSLHLSGFSQDGKRILGIFAEGGKHPSATIFDYHTDGGPVQLIDITKQFAHILPANCNSTIEVIGTTPTGSIVIELSSPNHCASSGRWLLDSSGKKPQRLTPGAAIVGLFPPPS